MICALCSPSPTRPAVAQLIYMYEYSGALNLGNLHSFLSPTVSASRKYGSARCHDRKKITCFAVTEDLELFKGPQPRSTVFLVKSRLGRSAG